MVFDPGTTDKKGQYNAPSGTGGSYSLITDNSAIFNFAMVKATAPTAVGNGWLTTVMQGDLAETVALGDRNRFVTKGNENVTITGIQRIKAAQIYLN